MKKILLGAVLAATMGAASAHEGVPADVEAKINLVSSVEYPTNDRMRAYVHEKLTKGYQFMQTTTHESSKLFAELEYPNKFDMQAYVYKQQVSAKIIMQEADNLQFKRLAVKEYPSNYNMQLATYRGLIEKSL